MGERRCIVYVGMDLFPPYNEIQSKTVYMLIRNLPPDQPFRVLSFANPHVVMGPPPDERHVAVPGRGRASAALGLTLTLLRETWSRKIIVHFVMPARHQRFVAWLTWLCRLRGAPTIFTVAQRTSSALGFHNVNVVVLQTRSAYERMRELLPGKAVRLIVPGSAETLAPDGRKRGKTVLFVGVPWSDADLEKRGVFSFFDVVRETLRRDSEVRFTLLNRALPQAARLDELAAEFPRANLTIHHGSFDRMSDWYGKHSVFLVLHRDDACPDPPLSAVEACCCGCAIVSTQFNGLAAELSEATAGVEVDTTAEAIADGIFLVLADEERFRGNALTLGKARYDEQAFWREYEKVYAEAQES
ncbi:MAG: glycosyltransferase [Deltaproteobacteria bacterium]